ARTSSSNTAPLTFIKNTSDEEQDRALWGFDSSNRWCKRPDIFIGQAHHRKRRSNDERDLKARPQGRGSTQEGCSGKSVCKSSAPSGVAQTSAKAWRTSSKLRYPNNS